MDNIVLDEEKSIAEFSELENSINKKYTLLIILVVVGSLIIYSCFFSYMTKVGWTMSWSFIFINVPGFLLGLLFALFPYKKLSYSKKYLRASFFCILVINVIMLFSVSVVLLKMKGITF